MSNSINPNTSNLVALRRDRLRTIVNSAGSRFVSIGFVKKDGSKRTITCQNACIATRAKGSTASDSAQRAVDTRKRNNPHLMNVFDINADGFKSVNLDSIFAIHIDRQAYDVS